MYKRQALGSAPVIVEREPVVASSPVASIAWNSIAAWVIAAIAALALLFALASDLRRRTATVQAPALQRQTVSR